MKTEFTLKIFTVFDIFFTIRIFEKLCAWPEKQSCPGNFHCIEYTFCIQEFWATCIHLPWKMEGALNSQYWLYIFYHSGFLSNLRFPWKTELPWNFSLYWNIFYHSGFLSNLGLPWKTDLPGNVSLYVIYFLHSEFLSNLHALALKNRVALIFFTVFEHVFCIIQEFWATWACPEKLSCPEIFRCMEYTFTFRIFEQLALALKNRVALMFSLYGMYFYILNFWATCAGPEKQRVPWIYCTEYIFFIIQEFWVTCDCTEKQSCPGIFHCIEYTLYILNFWATCACSEKQRVPWIYCIECIFFIIQDFSATCACSEKQSCPGIFHCTEIYLIILDFWATLRLPWNFSSPVGRPPPLLPTLRLVRLWQTVWQDFSTARCSY